MSSADPTTTSGPSPGPRRIHAEAGRNAAAALVALERLWGLDPDPEFLAGIALNLGSDVPFFLLGGTARGEGRGERLVSLPPMPPWGSGSGCQAPKEMGLVICNPPKKI